MTTRITTENKPPETITNTFLYIKADEKRVLIIDGPAVTAITTELQMRRDGTPIPENIATITHLRPGPITIQSPLTKKYVTIERLP